MTEEIQEIERLIKQSGELVDSLIRLAQRLREQHQRLVHEVDNERSVPHHEIYFTARRMVANGSITPQEAAVKLLQVAVIQGTMTPADAVEQVAKLLHPDLPISRRIELRETIKAAFEANDNVMEKIKPLLKAAARNEQTREHPDTKKIVAVTP
jgi:hypothetical protein